MESALYSIFRVDVRNLVKNKLYICKEYHIQPSEVDRMIFFEYEYMLDDIKGIQDQEKEEREKQERGEGAYKTPKMPDMNSMKSSMPNYSAPALPKISLPKL